MPDESTTPDLEELAQRLEDVMRAGDDLDLIVSLYAEDAVYDLSPAGLGVFEGQAAIRGVYEDFRSSYEVFEFELGELHDLGNGVTFNEVVNRGRPHGSEHWVEVRFVAVRVWAGGLIEREISYADIDEARAAAERLAQERG